MRSGWEKGSAARLSCLDRTVSEHRRCFPTGHRRCNEGLAGARVAKEVEAAVFRAAEEVRDAVAVEIDGGGTDVVPLNVCRGQRAGILEDPVAALAADLLQ